MSTAVRPSTGGSYLVIAAKANGGRSLAVRRARDRRALAEQLRRERLVPLRSWEMPEWVSLARGPRLSLKEQAELNTQLAQLLSRGVPLVEALDVTAAAIGPSARPMVQRMRELVAGGSSFADACMIVGGFDRVTVAVYRAAERTGDLAGAAKQLALTARRQLAVAGKAVTLMIYPAIVLSISTVMALLVITFIVPRIGEALKSSGRTLPAITEFIMQVGILLRDNWLWALLIVLGLITAAVFARKAITRVAGRLSRTTPLLREVVLAQEQARFFTVMAAMTKNGVPLAEALGVATGALGHPTLRRQLVHLQTRLIEGGVLRVLIDAVDTLPIGTRRLLIAAERSGDLTSAFETLAGDSAEELDRRSQRLLAALEPALIVFMFLVIGSLLLSILIPLMKLPQQIG